MKKSLLIFLSYANCLLPTVSFAQVPPQVAASGSWMEIRGSNQHTGVQLMKGNFSTAQPVKKWEFFGSWTIQQVDGEPVIGDIDGDGDGDVVVITKPAIYAIDGTTGTEMWKLTQPGANNTAAIGDVDGIPGVEVVVGASASTGNMKIYVLDGPTGNIKWDFPVNNVCDGPCIADVDGNGDMEIIFSNTTDLICLDGATGAVQWTYTSPSGVFAIAGVSSPAVADIDGNGTMEVVVGYNKGGPGTFGGVVALNGATGTLKWNVNFCSTCATQSSPAIADIDGNGDLEIVIGSQDNKVYAIDGTTGTVQWIFNTALGQLLASPAIADIDGNGTMEVLIANNGGTSSYLYCINGATGTQLWNYNVASEPSWHSGSPKIGDFNPTSPCMEIVISTSYANGGAYVYMFSSTGTLLWSYQNSTHNSEGIAIGDIDNDGCVEMVVTPDITSASPRSVYALDDPFGSSNCGSLCGLSCTSSAPTVSISGSTTICSGQNTTLTASGGGNYTWSTGASTSAINVSPTVTTTYSVTVGSGTCTATAIATVTVANNASVTISGLTTICTGNNSTLTASGGTNYSWNTGATTSSIVVSPSTTTTYSVISGSGNCADTASVTVTVGSGITASVSGNTTVCPGATVTLTASGGTNYSWNTGTTTSSISVSPTVTTNYSVVVSSGNCSDTASATVTVTNSITATISGSTSICTGGNTTLTASGGGNYTWSTGSTTASITVTSPGNYSVIVSSGNCSDTASVIVVVSSPPVANISGSDTICLGDNVVLAASGGGNYLWNTGQTSSSISVSPTSAANYSVIVSIGSCADTASTTITVIPSPTANAASNVTISQGQSTTLTASGGGNYLWSNGATTATITAAPAVTTVYCVWVTDADGCKDSSCVTVTVEPLDCSNAGELYLPNAFSPNGDGENDMLMLYYPPECIKKLKLVIYNRWGEKVFETSEIGFRWNGTYRGNKLNTAVFVYHLTAEFVNGNSINRKGNISLVR